MTNDEARQYFKDSKYVVDRCKELNLDIQVFA